MKMCPVCKTVNLTAGYQKTYDCPQCGGIWISAEANLIWDQAQAPITALDFSTADTRWLLFELEQATLCPDCGQFLEQYKIWPNLDFQPNCCQGCNGLWFKQTEWQTLMAQGLNDKPSPSNTERQLPNSQSESSPDFFEQRYQDKLDIVDYAEIKRIKAWLIRHPHGEGLLSYLLNESL